VQLLLYLLLGIIRKGLSSLVRSALLCLAFPTIFFLQNNLKTMEISTDEDLDNLFQDRFDLDTCSERSLFRSSAFSNNYIRTLYNNSKLHIRQPSRAISLFESKGHVGLLHLFLLVSIIESYRLYTNEKLANAGPGKTCCTIVFIYHYRLA